jgi:hypothetical protein
MISVWLGKIDLRGGPVTVKEKRRGKEQNDEVGPPGFFVVSSLPP